MIPPIGRLQGAAGHDEDRRNDDGPEAHANGAAESARGGRRGHRRGSVGADGGGRGDRRLRGHRRAAAGAGGHVRGIGPRRRRGHLCDIARAARSHAAPPRARGVLVATHIDQRCDRRDHGGRARRGGDHAQHPAPLGCAESRRSGGDAVRRALDGIASGVVEDRGGFGLGRAADRLPARRARILRLRVGGAVRSSRGRGRPRRVLLRSAGRRSLRHAARRRVLDREAARRPRGVPRGGRGGCSTGCWPACRACGRARRSRRRRAPAARRRA